MMIKRPGLSGADSSRHMARREFEEAVVINHEDQTVISDVPELQDFHASQSTSKGVAASEEELCHILGGAQPLKGGLPSRVPSIVSPVQHIEMNAVPAAPVRDVETRRSAAARKAASAEKVAGTVAVGVVKSPTLANTRSPELPAHVASTAMAAPGPVQPSAATMTRSNGTSHGPSPVPRPSAAAEPQLIAEQPVRSAPEAGSRFPREMPLALVLMGSAGLVSLVAGAVGQLARLTVLGAILTLCCGLAAGIWARDLSRNRAVRVGRALALPAFVGAALFAALFKS